MNNKSKNQTYEVWVEPEGTVFAFSTHEDIIEQKNKGLLSKKANLLHKFQAATWEEASSIYYLRMGYGIYKPVGEPELCPNKCGSYYYPQGSGECPYCGSI